MGKHDEAFILWFDDIGIEDVPLVGGKNASLGEMHQKLTSKGVDVPNGFSITAYAYRHLLKTAGIAQAIEDALADLDTHDLRNLQARGEKARQIIRTAEFPEDLRTAVLESYKKMEEMYGPNTDVAVRSSATAEDLPDASFAGQQETYLNIRGPEQLIDACRRCFASLFTDRAISYRHDKGFGQFDVYLSIVVQKMVRSDSAASGVLFSIDTESGFEDAVFITGAWGLPPGFCFPSIRKAASRMRFLLPAPGAWERRWSRVRSIPMSFMFLSRPSNRASGPSSARPSAVKKSR